MDLPVPENIILCRAIGIVQLPSLQADIHVFTVWRPTAVILDISIPVLLSTFRTSFSRLLDPENVDKAVLMSFLFYLRVYIVTGISGLETTILDCLLPVVFDSILTSTIG